MNRNKYLKRIGYTGEAQPSFITLCELQRLHLLHVPFENLDIHRKVTIIPENSYFKIVEGHRGGFCYELNSAFYSLLRDIGFDARLISARVFDPGKNTFGPEFDHMAIVVNLHQVLFLVDVGFGEFCFAPLKIETGIIQEDARGNFRIEQAEDNNLVVSRQTEQGFKPEYSFSLRPREIRDFQEMCLFHQTSPESHFTKKRICSLPVDKGRISLTENALKITSNGEVTIRELPSEEEVNEVLKNYFGIRL